MKRSIKFVMAVLAAAVIMTACPLQTKAEKKAEAKSENKAVKTESQDSKDSKNSKDTKKTDKKEENKAENKADKKEEKTAATIPQSVNKKGTYHVAQDGTGDFANIATAVVSVPSGSTLIIHEGIYNEALDIIGKVINMKGVSRDRCVIQYDTANYSRVPLNISGGIYDNLTIKGYHKSNNLAAFQGYAIHIDNDTLAGQTVTFNNCNIISENAFCVGIGLRRGARVAFRGCNFVAKKQGVILFHDSQTPALAGKAYLSLEGCNINNSTQELIVTQCLSPASVTEVTFKNNNVVGVGDGGCLAYGSYAGDGAGWMGAHNVILTKSSAGNNVMSMNYADMKQYQATLTEQAKANAAKLGASSPNISPSGKYYTLRTEDGIEINVPVENIDTYQTPGQVKESTPEVTAQNNSQPASEVSPSGKYYTITTEDGRQVNIPAENVDTPHVY